ncbi:hypothetical protein [Streptomyces sp. AC495_CC817]|uniref:hypothetical protein n=1 Tax=Streptomyces sp. AC495_CC817 TaxID=2823900 RepID=UPI001C26E719|nr:hypothetical protein [Streptomyces sp. AC495_CC817]
MADEPDGQRVVRVPGSRRARLTPAPGTDPSPETSIADRDADAPAKGPGPKGPNDDRLRQDVPPHY